MHGAPMSPIALVAAAALVGILYLLWRMFLVPVWHLMIYLTRK